MKLIPLLCAGLLLAGNAQAERQACMEVQIGQARALDYGCLTQQLQTDNAQKAAKALRDAQGFDASRQPGNRLGLFNQSATSQRMGNTFGNSAFPQRPPTP